MPRPKRTKIASVAPTRVAKDAPPSENAPAPKRSGRRKAQLDEESDKMDMENNAETQEAMEKTLAVPKTRGRPRAGAKKAVPTAAQTKTLDRLRKKMDAAQSNVISANRSSPPPTVTEAKRGKRTERGTRTSGTQHVAIERATSTPPPVEHAERPRTPSPNESEELYGLSPAGKARPGQTASTGKPTQSKLYNKPPQSTVKAQGTPAVETSILALTNFRRRPRQPSILRMVQQKSDQIDDDMDDFDPDDESTPFTFGKTKDYSLSGIDLNTPPAEEPRTSSSRKRKRPTPEVEPEIQVLRSSPPLEDDDDDDSIAESLPGLPTDPSSLPEHVTQSQGGTGAPQDDDVEMYSETMAPPKSSSSLYGDDDVPGGSTPKGGFNDRRPSAASQTSPSRVRKNTRSTKEKGLSTAALQALLPQRKRRAKSAFTHLGTFDIPSSDDIESALLDSDEDELQSHSRRGGSRRTVARTPVGGRKKGDLTRPSNSPVSAKKRSAAGRTSRTYGRRNSDKENYTREDTSEEEEEDNDDGDVTMVEGAEKQQPIDISKSKELKAVADKFKEVDEWEMEFESVDTGGTSSPWR